MLIEYFLAEHGRVYRVEPKPLSRDMIRMMERYHWPGNIRQLENLIRSYVLIGDEEALTADLIPGGAGGLIPEINLANPVSLKEITKGVTRTLEHEIILKVLKANGWSRRKTAKWLNISYRSLLYKLQESGMGPLKPR